MTGDLDSVLQTVFGDDWEWLSEEERAIARRVADWYENFGKNETMTAYERDVVNAIWASAREELGPERSSLIATRRRDRDVNDVRASMYRITHELLPSVPKSQIARVLGIERDHATLLYALSRCNDLVEIDPAFRAMYLRLYRHTIEHLEEGAE